MVIADYYYKGAMLNFLPSGVEKLLAYGRGFEPTTLDQSGAYNLSAMSAH